MVVNNPLLMSQPQIGNFIREIRLAANLTQEQFAGQLGVTCSTMNRWERGRSKPSPLALQKIEQLLEQMSETDLLAKYLAD
jgi:putative transcriptional regulator